MPLGISALRRACVALLCTLAAASINNKLCYVHEILAMATESSRPLLLPQNRRLRHLQGIYLRNLTLTRPRGVTIDDATLNKTPEKLEALREALRDPQLHHAASSDNLNAKIRPNGMRRRSTIWAGQSPAYRQKKLEDVIENGMVDTFFSLHCAGEKEPIYISEVVEKAMVCNMSPLVRHILFRQSFFYVMICSCVRDLCG